METRVCKECGQDKDIDCFHLKKGINRYKRKDGTIVIAPYTTRRWVCIKCMNDIYTADYVRRNREKVLNKTNEWHKYQKDNKTDFYYKALIASSRIIPIRLITKEIITIKRKQHEIREIIKEYSQ